MQRTAPPPAPPTVYCSTGAGPISIEGFDWHTGAHPSLSHVTVLSWRRDPRDHAKQMVALQPPFDCHEIGVVSLRDGDVKQ